MGKLLSIAYGAIYALLCVGILASSVSGQSSDEAVKQAFLKSRETNKSSQKQKKKKVKPKVASKKKTPKPTPRPTSRPTSTPPARPAVTPAPSTSSPTPAPSRSAPSPSISDNRIVVRKTDLDEEDLPPPAPVPKGWWFFRKGPRYKYLTPAVLKAINEAPVKRNRWRYIVVHNSGTRQGNAKAFDYYHTKVRKMPNGMAYHFVIGNGTSSGNGAIEIGSRWTRQINGGHVHSDYLNNIAIGICLVGDFNRDKPTPQQLEALDELIRYLRRRVGKTDRREAIVRAHRDINPRPTDCPGDRFPYRWLYSRFE